MSEEMNQERLHFTSPAAESGPFGLARGQPVTTQPADVPTVEESGEEQHVTLTAIPLPIEGELPSLAGATVWLNSPPLMATGLRGHVVLVEFWTYTCINWLRTMPYVRAWAEKYKDQGLVVVGVHTPEFSFEHTVENVRRAATDMRVAYPIAIDNDYAVWSAFNNHYWPALYVVDANGHIRHHHFGEGGYERTERAIQRLLGVARIGGIGDDLVPAVASGVEAAADWGDLESPETYLGYERTENFASPGGMTVGGSSFYIVPAQLGLNEWALMGEWTVGNEASMLNRASGGIACCFHARDLHLVMGPAAHGASVPFHVRIDGHPPGPAHGADVDDQGNGTASEQRLYQLIRQSQPIVDRQFEIEFLHPGVEVFAFTFG